MGGWWVAGGLVGLAGLVGWLVGLAGWAGWAGWLVGLAGLVGWLVGWVGKIGFDTQRTIRPSLQNKQHEEQQQASKQTALCYVIV